MPGEVDDLDPRGANGDPVTVLDQLVDRQWQVAGIEGVRERRSLGDADDRLERRPVVLVVMGGDDPGEVASTAVDLPQQGGRVGSRVDEDGFSGTGAAQQVGVVAVTTDQDLGDRQAGDLALLDRAGRSDLAGVVHAGSARSRARKETVRCPRYARSRV